SNPAFAALNVQPSTPGQRPINLDPATRQTELRTLAAMHQRRGIVNREGNVLDPATRQSQMHTLAAMRERRGLGPGQANSPDAETHERRTFATNNETLATMNPQRHVRNRDPEAGPQPGKHELPKDNHGKKWHNKK